MSAGLPEKPNSLDILLKVALAGTESAAAEKESDKSLSSSETYTPTHKPSSKKRPLGDISATVSNQSSNHSQPSESLELTKENLNLVQQRFLGLTPGKQNVAFEDQQTKQINKFIVGPLIGKGAYKDVYELDITCDVGKKLVFISSRNPLSNIPGPFEPFSHTPQKKQAIAFEGISGEHLMELDTSSKLTTLQLLVMELKDHHSKFFVHTDLKPQNFVFSRDNEEGIILDASWIDRDSFTQKADPIHFPCGTIEFSPPQVTQLYDRLNEIRQSTLSLFHKEITFKNAQSLRIAHHKLKQNIAAFSNFYEIDFNPKTSLGNALLKIISPTEKNNFQPIPNITCCNNKFIYDSLQYLTHSVQLVCDNSRLSNIPLLIQSISETSRAIKHHITQAQASEKMDIWSLGCTIIKIVTKKHLHEFYPNALKNINSLRPQFYQEIRKYDVADSIAKLGVNKLLNKMFYNYHSLSFDSDRESIRQKIYEFVNHKKLMSRKEKQLICNIVDLALQCVQPNPARQISLQALLEGLDNISSGTYQESETTSESYSYSDISSSVDPTQFDQQETEGTEIIDHSNTGSSQTFMIKRSYSQ